MRLSLWFVVVAVLVSMAGCQSLMQPSTEMSASQMKELVKDKNASVICASVIGAWGTAKTVVINLDQNAIKDGGISIDGEKGCTASITSMAPVKPVLPAPPTPVRP